MRLEEYVQIAGRGTWPDSQISNRNLKYQDSVEANGAGRRVLSRSRRPAFGVLWQYWNRSSRDARQVSVGIRLRERIRMPYRENECNQLVTIVHSPQQCSMRSRR